MKEKLDLNMDEGGSGWNKQRAESFAKRVEDIVETSKKIKTGDINTGPVVLADYIERVFKLGLDKKDRDSLLSTLKLRLNRKIDRIELERRLDVPKNLGGLGLYKSSAEKVSREVEMIMLINYQ